MSCRMITLLSHLTLAACVLCAPPGILALDLGTSDAAAAPAWTVVERDLLQTRNFVPVINHSTVVSNLDDADLALTIRSPVPPELDRSGPFWPRFGSDAVAGSASMAGGARTLPDELARSVLGKPERMSGTQGGYEWRAAVGGKHALVAGYTNYFGAPDAFAASPERLQLLDLQIGSRFSMSHRQDLLVLTVEIELANTGARPLSALQFKLCFPETVIDAAQQTQRLWSVRAHRVQGDAVYSSVGHVDGLGRRVAAGHAASLTVDALAAGERRRFALELSGVLLERDDVLFPSYLVGFVEAEGGRRIWPASVVLSSSAAAPERRYYREAAMLLPAPRRYAIHGMEADVVAVPGL